MAQKTLTILICTHNRANLLESAVDSLNRAEMPSHWRVNILVVANACTDDTHALLSTRVELAPPALSLDWIEEPRPGKSYALNTAIPLIKTSDIVAFVDDDHQVDAHYICSICNAVDTNLDYSMFCGRILPDWDGTEPSWVHEVGPYRIRPLPIPRSDGGPLSREITLDDPTPGGGNLFIRGSVFDRVGNFPTDMGPKGHDLGGGEDTVFIRAALSTGERLRYIPEVIQHHYVDANRFQLGYLLRKAFQRSRSLVSVHHGSDKIPTYLWRKLLGLVFATSFSFRPGRRRFFAVRTANALGEIVGIWQTNKKSTFNKAERRRNWLYFAIMLTLLMCSGILFILHAPQAVGYALTADIVVAGIFTTLISIKSASDFTHTGPHLHAEILSHYRIYTVLTFLRLVGFTFLLIAILAMPGIILSGALMLALASDSDFILLCGSGLFSVLYLSIFQFCKQLLYLPANITASYNYRISRLYPIWKMLTPFRIQAVAYITVGIATSILIWSSYQLFHVGLTSIVLALMCLGTLGGVLLLWVHQPDPKPIDPARVTSRERPNIVMIGSDTLRSDRVDGSYAPVITPFLSRLSDKRVLFTHCYVPCARTAPSLLSLLTGQWPHRFNVRDNFVSDEQSRLDLHALPHILKLHGYFTAGISDWCGADMHKFHLGFNYTDVPKDQWNIKYFIRQGPKDLRLLLSLFLHNRIGKIYLPEIYYLGGIPLTDDLGKLARNTINHLAKRDEPFFLNLFFSTTHGPFGSEYPYYTMYSDPNYMGESKYVMSRLTDPFEIIRRQGEPKDEFDLDQIIHLYDGCVTRFDDEVQRIFDHLKHCGLMDDTIIVVYSDHGMDFFEHGTWGQGNSAIGDYSSRVPMLVVSPNIEFSRIVDDPVRSIDLVPTLLEMVNIQYTSKLDGTSLQSYLKDPRAHLELDAFSETGIWLTKLPGMPANHISYPGLFELLEVNNINSGTISIKPEFEQIIIKAKDRMIRRGRWKLVYQPLSDGYRLMLFDMQNDQKCLTNLIYERPEIADLLWDKLKIWITQDPKCQGCV